MLKESTLFTGTDVIPSSVDNGTILTILDPVEGCCRVEHRTERNDHYICKV